MQRSEVTCDACQADLSDQDTKRIVTLVRPSPSMPHVDRTGLTVETCHFCHLMCLRKWATQEKK